MELPKEKVPPKSLSPSSLMFFGHPKLGKTTLLSQLDNCLILDFEGGTNSISALKVNIDSFETLREVINQIKEDGKPYKYIAVDTVSKLERMCSSIALKLYQKTPMGKKFTGDVLTLPKGAGYGYLRTAILQVLQEIASCTNGPLILVGHVKNKYIEREGKEYEGVEVDLTGKIGKIISGEVDALAYAYRDKGQIIFDFQHSEDVICGSRQKHLLGQKIVMSEENENGDITCHWDRIFID